MLTGQNRLNLSKFVSGSMYLHASPPNSGERFCRDHIQGVPGRDAQAVVKAQHENHHGLAGAKPQEEAADA